MYPLVRELAVDGIPVTVTCRVLKIARQPYYRWLAQPGHRRASSARRYLANAVVRRPPRRPRVRLPVPRRRGPRGRPRRSVTGRCGGSAATTAGGRRSASPSAARTAKPGPPAHDDLVRRDFTADGAEPAVARRHHRAPHRRGQALPLRDQGRASRTGSSGYSIDSPDEGPARRRRDRDGRRPPR